MTWPIKWKIANNLKSRLIGLACRVFTNGPGDRGSIPSWIIPKTQKMVIDSSLLNSQHYKVWIKGKVEQFKERSSILPYTLKRELSSHHRLRPPALLLFLSKAIGGEAWHSWKCQNTHVRSFARWKFDNISSFPTLSFFYLILYSLTLKSLFSPVDWSCRILGLYLCSEVKPPTHPMSVLDMIQIHLMVRLNFWNFERMLSTS